MIYGILKVRVHSLTPTSTHTPSYTLLKHIHSNTPIYTHERAHACINIHQHILEHVCRRMFTGTCTLIYSLSHASSGIRISQLKDMHHHHHHHHVVPLARIYLTLSHHFSLSFIASGRSPEPHPVSSHSCCMYVRAGRPTFARLYVGVHRGTSPMSSSLLLQQWPACLVRLIWIVFMMGGRWPYSWYDMHGPEQILLCE